MRFCTLTLFSTNSGASEHNIALGKTSFYCGVVILDNHITDAKKWINLSHVVLHGCRDTNASNIEVNLHAIYYVHYVIVIEGMHIDKLGKTKSDCKLLKSNKKKPFCLIPLRLSIFMSTFFGPLHLSPFTKTRIFATNDDDLHLSRQPLILLRDVQLTIYIALILKGTHCSTSKCSKLCIYFFF